MYASVVAAVAPVLTGCGGRPEDPALRVYVTNERSEDLSVIDAATRAVVATVPLGKRPRGIGVALTPDGRTAFTANGPSNDVSVVDTATMRVVGRIPVGERPWGVAVVETPPR